MAAAYAGRVRGNGFACGEVVWMCAMRLFEQYLAHPAGQPLMLCYSVRFASAV